MGMCDGIHDVEYRTSGMWVSQRPPNVSLRSPGYCDIYGKWSPVSFGTQGFSSDADAGVEFVEASQAVAHRALIL